MLLALVRSVRPGRSRHILASGALAQGFKRTPPRRGARSSSWRERSVTGDGAGTVGAGAGAETTHPPPAQAQPLRAHPSHFQVRIGGLATIQSAGCGAVRQLAIKPETGL